MVALFSDFVYVRSRQTMDVAIGDAVPAVDYEISEWNMDDGKSCY
jgi:hypothetical protein